jgi:hypothetical protein
VGDAYSKPLAQGVPGLANVWAVARQLMAKRARLMHDGAYATFARLVGC